MKVAVIAGPTGSGKSDLAVHLAERLPCEIVNYDSVQVYHGFDIGSAKPSLETRGRIPHHLYDFLDAETEFNVADYARMARSVCEQIVDRGNLPLLVGGTFFYLRAFLSGLPDMPGRNDVVRARLRRIAATPRGQARLHRWLSRVDPKSGGRIAPADRHRLERALEVWITAGRPISTWERPGSAAESGILPLYIALTMPRPELNRRLDERVEAMYRQGLVDETRMLLGRYSRIARPFGSIGYREAAAVVAGEIDLPTAIVETKRRTRAYAKRQMTWLRSERNVHWLDAGGDDTFATAQQLIERLRVE